MDVAKTKPYRDRLKQLEEDSYTWREHWQELQEYMLPRKGKYLDNNDPASADHGHTSGDKKNQRIINSVASQALRVIAAGMQGGLTSPSRPWFRLGLSDLDLMQYGPVKEYLHEVQQRMLTTLSRSNFYGAIHGRYTELAAFGTASMMIEEDLHTGVRFRPFTIGEYYLAQNSQYRVNALYRKLSMTAVQMVNRFGAESVSRPVLEAAKDNAKSEKRFTVVHVIQPNMDRMPGRMLSEDLPFESVYFEMNCEDKNQLLNKSGYRDLPFVAPRWDVTGTNVWGNSPAMDALGDCKMLQKMEEKKLKALDKMVDPPMNAPTSMKGQGGSIVAGGVNYLDITQGQQGFVPAYQVNPETQNIGIEIARVEERLKRAFFNDLFLMVASADKSMTATEVVRRHEEKLLMLGPVLERLQSELLDVIIDRTFDILQEEGVFPPPPPEIQGAPLKVEYISLLSQAQKMTGTTAITELAGFVGQLAAVNPEVIDKFDADQAVDDYADMLGVNPDIVNADDEVEEIRASRKQAEQMAAAQAQMDQGVANAKTMSETPVGEQSALDMMLGGI